MGEIAKWKEHQQEKHLMDALCAVASGLAIPLTRVHTIQVLPLFKQNTAPNETYDWVTFIWKTRGRAFLQTTMLQREILRHIQSKGQSCS